MAQPSLNLPYLVLSSVVVIAIVVVFTVFREQYVAISAARTTLATTQAQLEERLLFLQTLDAKRAELVAQAANERALEVGLPVEDAVDDVLRIVNTSADRAGVVVQQVVNASSSAQVALEARRARGEDSVVPADVLPLTVTLQIGGTYQQVRALLEGLERSVRLIDVSALRLSRDTNEVERLSGELSLRFYQYQGVP